MFLELNPTGGFNESHKQLLETILQPAIWKETGNIPALTRLIKSFLRKDISTIIQSGKLSAVLGIFQKLLDSPLQDQHGFAILVVVLEVTLWDTLSPLVGTIFSLIFTRLTKKKTNKLCSQFVLFLCRFIHKYSLQQLLDILTAISPGIITNVMKVWVTVLPQLQLAEELQVATIVTSQILNNPLMVQGDLAKHWAPLTVGVAQILFLRKTAELVPEDDLFAEQAANRQSGLATSFAKLVHSATEVTADRFLNEVLLINKHEFAVSQLRQLKASMGPSIQPALQEVAKDKLGSQLCAELV